MWKKLLVSGMIAAAVLAVCSSEALAQFNPGYDVLRNATIRRPTVSPYLGLASPSGGYSAYFTLVRPTLQQQAINQQATQTFRELQQSISQVSERSRAEPRARRGIRATGHPTAFMFYGSYYPTLGRR